MGKLYKAFIDIVGCISVDKYLHFIAGLLVAAFFALVFPTTAPWCVVFAIVAGVGKEVVDQITYSGWDWLDLAATIAGGVIIQIFALLGIYC